MEGSESEELKSVKRGSPECLQVKRKRVDKKKKKHGASRLQIATDADQVSVSWVEGGGGVDASQGSSECRRVKCKSFNKKKKKHASRLQKGTDVSEGDMAGGSDLHQVKLKRVEEESFSWLQRCTDASSKGDIAGGSEHRQVERKRVKHKLQRCTDASSKGEIAGGSEHCQVERKRVKHKRLNDGSLSWLVEYRKQLALEHAKMALEFYEKSQDDAEFEILEVLNLSNSRLQHPESESGHLWSHISFFAKPRKADCNVSPKHFFGEYFRDDDSGKIHVTYCSTFQPSDDLGFNHGCIFCPLGQKFHPSDGYCVGRPPWHRRIVVFGHPSRLTPKA